MTAAKPGFDTRNEKYGALSDGITLDDVVKSVSSQSGAVYNKMRRYVQVPNVDEVLTILLDESLKSMKNYRRAKDAQGQPVKLDAWIAGCIPGAMTQWKRKFLTKSSSSSDVTIASLDPEDLETLAGDFTAQDSHTHGTPRRDHHYSTMPGLSTPPVPAGMFAQGPDANRDPDWMEKRLTWVKTLIRTRQGDKTWLRIQTAILSGSDKGLQLRTEIAFCITSGIITGTLAKYLTPPEPPFPPLAPRTVKKETM